MPYAPPVVPSSAPYDAIVRITYQWSSGQAYQASGVMVSPDVVLTAGHVVDDDQLASISIAPDPSGSAASDGSTGATAVAWLPGAPTDGLLTQAQSADDLGLIALAGPLGAQTGWMALDPGFAGGTVETAGYPASYGGALEAAQLTTALAPATATLDYPAGTVQPGSSGSPLWTELDGQPAVVGVVSTLDWATQLTAADAAFVAQFVQLHPAATSAAVTATGSAATPFQFAAPVDGVSTADVSSLEITGQFGDPTLDFLPGTQTVQLLDGRLELGQDSNAAFLTRLYAGLLGRAPDAAGLSALDGALGAGASRTDIAADMLASPEYAASHAGLTDAQYVQTLYAGILGRAADPAGLASWSAALASGDSRADVAAQVASSPEAQAGSAGGTWVQDPNAAAVSDLYQVGLDRAPSASDLQFWTGALGNGLSLPALAADIAGSAEFAAAHAGQGTTAFVTSLYADGFGAAPDAAGLQFWAGALQSGAVGRADVLLGLAQSSQANAGLRVG